MKLLIINSIIINMRKKFSIVFYLLFFTALIFFPLSGKAIAIGESRDFNIERTFDHFNRDRISAFLNNITGRLAFFVDQNWWDRLSSSQRDNVSSIFNTLSLEFNNRIYPQMTSVFGETPSHPVDQSEKISILLHRMTRGTGGYFNSADFYSVFQAPKSNELNMFYINTDFLASPFLKGFLAHEFMHIITFNAKERERNVREEVWLNEARAEFASTFMNYLSEEENNILRRKNTFINNSGTSLTEWRNTSGDYAIVNMFVHYLVDHYGIEILVDSLNSNYVGIESINYALRKNGHKENFSDVFTDWTIAVLVNDCSLGARYCYKNEFLTDLRVVPLTTYLSTNIGISASARHSTKNWAGNWHRFVGSAGNLRLQFKPEQNVNYRLPYLLCVTESSCVLNFAEPDRQNRAIIDIKDFGKKYFSLTIIPSIQHKMTGFNGLEPSIFFDWSVESYIEEPREVKETRCRIDQNLFSGITRSDQVRCLQEFLRDQGPAIYPEGLITGNFFSLTRRAVIRFQEKYASEILTPLGLTRGTGRVGTRTRNKINQLLSI